MAPLGEPSIFFCPGREKHSSERLCSGIRDSDYQFLEMRSSIIIIARASESLPKKSLMPPEAAVLADVGLVLVLGVTLLDVADLPAVEGDITGSVAADILLLRDVLDVLTEIRTLLDDSTLVISLGYLVKGIRI